MVYDLEKLLKQFEEKSIELDKYVSAKNILWNKEYSSKKSIRMGKSLTSIAVKLINLDIDAFVKLLDHNDIVVSKSAAEYLYPLYPKKCLCIMRAYRDTLTDNLDIYTMDTKIQGYEKKQKFFMDEFKRTFNCEDLENLNREK